MRAVKGVRATRGGESFIPPDSETGDNLPSTIQKYKSVNQLWWQSVGELARTDQYKE